MNTTLKMSVEGDVIKQERSETPENVQNSDTVLNSGPVEPEFVNIKTELPENIRSTHHPRRRVTYAQLEALWEYLNSHRDIAIGCNKSAQARSLSRKMWENIAVNLNSMREGAIKNWRAWSVYWVDYKAKLKKRAAGIKASHSWTDGGPSEVPALTELELKFLDILGQDYRADLHNIQVDPFREVATLQCSNVSEIQSHGLPQCEEELKFADAQGETESIASHSVEASQPVPEPLQPVPEALQSVPETLQPVPETLQPVPETSQPVLETSQAAVSDIAPSVSRSPARSPVSATARRRRRAIPPYSQETARRALVEATEARAAVEQRNSATLEGILKVLTRMTEVLERIERSIKTEPQSDDEWEQSSEPSWHTRFLETRVSVKVEPTMDRGDDGKIEITVKQEPPDIQTHNNNYNEKLYLRMVNEPTTIDPNTSNDTASEEELCQNATADGKYMCPICHKRFSNKGNVQRHVLLHSRIRLQCSVCCKQFFKQNQLDKHMITHTNDKKYECTTCGKFFRSSSNLQQHKKIHLEVKPHACDVCFKTFAVRANLLKHQGKSRCKKPLLEPITCKICGKIFQKEFLLKSHLRKHTDEKPFTCETCKMSFKYKSTMIRHIQLHNGIKPYSCKICGKTFTHAGLIKPHMRIHTGEKPYRCPICDRTFAHKHNMLRHTLRHNKIKHLTCDICQKKFPKESRLKYHMRTHTKEKPFSCDICLKNFSHKQNVIRHFQRKHPKEISF